MSHSLELHCAILEWTIDLVEDVNIDDPLIQQLDAALRELRKRVDVTALEVVQTGSGTFTYEVVRANADQIEGALDYTSGDPTITVSAPDPWPIAAFAQSRIMETITNAITSAGMTDLGVTFF